MSLLGKAKRLGRKAKHAADKAAAAVEDTAGAAADAVEGAAKDTVDAAADATDAAADFATQKLEDEMTDVIKRLGNEVTAKVEGVGKSAVHRIEDTANAGVGKLEAQGRKQLATLQGTGDEYLQKLEGVSGEVLHTLESTGQYILGQGLAFASSKAFAVAVRMIRKQAPDSYSLTVGPVTMEIEDVASRIDTLVHWRDHPPTGRRDIREIVTTLAPTSVNVGVDIALAAFVATSSSLSIGWNQKFKTADFLDLFEFIMDEIGLA